MTNTTTYKLPDLGWTLTMKGDDDQPFEVQPFVRMSNAITGDDSYTGATVIWGLNDKLGGKFSATLEDFGEVEDEMGHKVSSVQVFGNSLEELDEHIHGAFYDLYDTYGVKNNYGLM